MIKILKHGKKYSKFQLTCPFCDCEFEYEESDLKDNSFINCLDCGAIIDHSFYQRKKISEQFWKRLNQL